MNNCGMDGFHRRQLKAALQAVDEQRRRGVSQQEGHPDGDNDDKEFSKMTDSSFLWPEVCKTDRFKTDTVVRVAFSFVAGTILSVAYLPKIVPPSLSPNIIVIVSCTFTFPPVLFTLCGVLPMFLLVGLGCTMFATILLCTLAVSDGLLVAVYSLYTYWTLAVYFGEKYDSTWAMGQIFLSIVPLFTLSVRPALLMVPKGERLALVRAMWTESGVDNELAIMRNLMITVSWVFAIYVARTLLPLPRYRTARTSIATELLPGLLKETAEALTGQNDESSQKAIVSSLSAGSKMLKGGEIAKMAAFEPPPLGSKHGFLTKELNALSTEVDKSILMTICAMETPLMSSKTNDIEEQGSEELLNIRKKSAALLAVIAKALAQNDKDAVVLLEKYEVDEDQEANAFHSIYSRACTLRLVALDWLRAFHGLGPRRSFSFRAKELAQFVATTVLYPFMGWPQSMIQTCINHTRSRNWRPWAFMWKVKRTIGAVILFCMSVYWEAFANFAINRDYWRLGAVFLRVEYLCVQ